MYTLLNKENGKVLKHPKVGLWFTPELKEAQNMLGACKEYVATINKDMVKNFVIINAESGKEIDDGECLSSS